jgi:hypothetical protein
MRIAQAEHLLLSGNHTSSLWFEKWVFGKLG